jgi:hypothetical protein
VQVGAADGALVTVTMAPRGFSIVGSVTVSQRMSCLPRQHRAFMMGCCPRCLGVRFCRAAETPPADVRS